MDGSKFNQRLELPPGRNPFQNGFRIALLQMSRALARSPRDPHPLSPLPFPLSLSTPPAAPALFTISPLL
ncbi:hypothetical protein AMTR_s00119p00057020 [Amborella trichopoda]|uniref:Uncharacterized protein n=1 Tax=Amborella trichopoda TaxID=13333 RepID=W1NNE3_AMBTC|nr:hypothetical protein AMTR_s00119p00057020 [Amborella trichopoda]